MPCRPTPSAAGCASTLLTADAAWHWPTVFRHVTGKVLCQDVNRRTASTQGATPNGRPGISPASRPSGRPLSSPIGRRPMGRHNAGPRCTATGERCYSRTVHIRILVAAALLIAPASGHLAGRAAALSRLLPVRAQRAPTRQSPAQCAHHSLGRVTCPSPPRNPTRASGFCQDAAASPGMAPRALAASRRWCGHIPAPSRGR